MNSARGASPYSSMQAVRPSPPQSMVNHGRPSRSIVAIAEPSSTADALPTPCRRSDQAISVPLRPSAVVGAAQTREVALHGIGRTLAAHLQQRALQPGEVALAPAGGRDVQPAPVQIDHPALA